MNRNLNVEGLAYHESYFRSESPEEKGKVLKEVGRGDSSAQISNAFAQIGYTYSSPRFKISNFGRATQYLVW